MKEKVRQPTVRGGVSESGKRKERKWEGNSQLEKERKKEGVKKKGIKKAADREREGGTESCRQKEGGTESSRRQRKSGSKGKRK